MHKTINKYQFIFESSACLSLSQMKAYLKGEFNSKEKHSFEKHIHACDACKEEFEGLLAMKNPEALENYVLELNANIDKRIENKVVRFYKHFYRYAALLIILLASAIFLKFYLFKEARLSDKQVVYTEKTPTDPKIENSKEPIIAKAQTIEKKTETKHRKATKTNKKISKLVKSDQVSFDNNKISKEFLSDDAEISAEEIVITEPEIQLKNSDSSINYNAALLAERRRTEKEKDNAMDFDEKKEEVSSNKGFLSSNSINEAREAVKKSKTKKLTPDIMSMAIEYYQIHQYDQAIKLLKKETDTEQKEYYLALSYKGKKDYVKAAIYWEKLFTSNKYHETAQWEYSQAQIKINNFAKAVLQLQNLIKNNSPRSDDAQLLIDSLNAQKK